MILKVRVVQRIFVPSYVEIRDLRFEINAQIINFSVVWIRSACSIRAEGSVTPSDWKSIIHKIVTVSNLACVQFMGI